MTKIPPDDILEGLYKLSPRIPLYTLFCPWNLDHGVSLIISISGAKIHISYVLLDTSLHHSFQPVIIRSYFLQMNLQVVQFQYGLEFLRHSCVGNGSPTGSVQEETLAVSATVLINVEK